MNPQAERLIRETWALLLPSRIRAAERFYARLFEIEPATRGLFEGHSLHAQYEKFLLTLDGLVQMLDYPPQVIEDVQSLGKRHVGYGVLLEHYGPVGEALLWTLEQELGADYTPEVARAWSELYLLIAGVMQRAAASQA